MGPLFPVPVHTAHCAFLYIYSTRRPPPPPASPCPPPASRRTSRPASIRLRGSPSSLPQTRIAAARLRRGKAVRSFQLSEMAESFVLNTGARIPAIGLGTSQAEPGVVGQAIYAAVKAGYRHVDCAPAYHNEKEIGLALKKLLADGVVKREDLFITSKLWCGNQAPEDVPEGIEATLEDLQLDYLDLFLIHSPVRSKKGATPNPENFLPLDIPATWGAMEKLYSSGKAHAIGVSNFSCKKMEDLLAIARVPPAVNQVESHPIWQQMKLRELCQSKGVHFSAYSPLGKARSPGFTGPTVLSNPIVVSVAEKLQKTSAQVALRWGLQMGQNVLPKSTNESRLKENLNIFDWSIPEDLMAKFSEIQQVKMLRAEFVVHPQGIYKTVEDFWDGEI